MANTTEEIPEGDYPAFPTEIEYDLNTNLRTLAHGLTKREYIATMAMQGYISDSQQDQGISTKDVLNFLGFDESVEYDYGLHYPMYVAKKCAIFADVLIAELNK